MNLDTIRNFDWYNEPDFSFDSGNLIVKATPDTDFWQDKRNNIFKDDGHFFFTERSGDFVLTVKWKRPTEFQDLCQFGLMSRIDKNNWCKVSAIKVKDSISLFISVTHYGVSDMVLVPLSKDFNHICYRLHLQDNIFNLSYSQDGTDFIVIRNFQMLKDFSGMKIGAYCSNPNISNNMKEFRCVLEDVSIV